MDTSKQKKVRNAVKQPCEIDGCERLSFARGLCDVHDYRQRTYGDPLAELKAPRGLPLADRFWPKVAITADANRCWEWTRAVRPQGYGIIKVNGKSTTATHVAFYLFHGRWSDKWLLHSCDNRMCVNPHHLREGDVLDNARDMVERKRNQRGEDKPFAKLKAADIPVIRALLADGRSCHQVSKMFGVVDGTIRQIKERATWTHI